MRRRHVVRDPVLATITIGGGMEAALGSSAIEVATREADQNAKIGQREQQQEAPPSPPVAAAPVAPTPSPEPVSMDRKIAQLRELGALRDAGVLTEAEFAVVKEQILTGT
jgi:hypothetical protein